MHMTLMDLPDDRVNLLPLTYLKSIADLRIGILTIREKWAHWMGSEPAILTASYLQSKYQTYSGTGTLINATILPNRGVIDAIQRLPVGTSLMAGDVWIAAHVEDAEKGQEALTKLEARPFGGEVHQLHRTWDIFQQNPAQIISDYDILTSGRSSQKVSDPHTVVYGNQIFCEEDVEIKAAILNAEGGPIYLGKGVKLGEGAIIQGPAVLCEGSQLSLGAKVRGNVTVGPASKLGGEVSNSVIQGYSNKSHDGYLGSAVVGEWCNLGAATNNSNLKNNYAKVKMWDFGSRGFRDSGQQFCGLIMGDHSRCAINTTFNTGTTTGIMTNIFGAGFPRNYIPSFSWGGTGGFSTYAFKRALESAERAMTRRGKSFSELEVGILQHVFDQTAIDRTWEGH